MFLFEKLFIWDVLESGGEMAGKSMARKRYENGRYRCPRYRCSIIYRLEKRD